MVQRLAGGLPTQVTGFVGRDAEVVEVGKLLGHARLVTTLGPGGVGKTRLTLRAAEGVQDRYRDGVCLIELAELREPDLLVHTVATALGLPEQDTRPQLDVLVEYLRDREILLILDTCEHVLDAGAMLVDVLLREAPEVRVLATSRQPLDVPGEHCLTVPPLKVPELTEGAESAAPQGGGEAVELFEQRAAAVVPGFRITADNRDDVIKLCRRLDGIPLAIELAVVRLRAVPLAQLIERLEDRFRLLTGGRRAAMSRHQTLAGAIDWSHELCTEQERVLWRRLSVFAGPFDIATVEQVCADETLTCDDILETLIGLVDKSVVQRIDGETTRYRQLDTIREFGAEKLAEAGEETALRRRHLDHYHTRGAEFSRRFTDDDQVKRFNELRREHSDVRAALNHALLLEGEERRAAQLCTSLWGYWQMSGRLTEACHWFDRVLERFPDPGVERASCLAVRSYVATFRGDLERALSDLEDAAPMAEAAGATLLRARIDLYLHLVLSFLVRGEEAGPVGEAGRRRMEEIGDEIGQVCLDVQIAYQHYMVGNMDTALRYCRAGMERLGKDSREHWLRGYLYTVITFAKLSSGEVDAAKEAACTALRIKHASWDVVGVAYTMEALGWVASTQQRPLRATWLLGAAEVLWQQVGVRLSGNAVLEQIHRDSIDAAQRALGERRCAEVFAEAARRPLDEMVAMAVDDTDGPEAPALVEEPPGAAEQLLTSREREVAALVAEGMSNREIAQRLVVSKRTVDAHVEHILAKLGVSSRVMIARIILREDEA